MTVPATTILRWQSMDVLAVKDADVAASMKFYFRTLWKR
jgi:hypothetical protein